MTKVREFAGFEFKTLKFGACLLFVAWGLLFLCTSVIGNRSLMITENNGVN